MARRPQMQRLRSVTVPAPLGGLNTVDAGLAMPPGDCIYAYNVVASELGLRSRLGWREWCTGLTGATDNSVRSVLPFNGGQKNGSTDRLFACTDTGIWDVTSSSAAPTQVLAFDSSAGEAGYGHACVMTTAGGRFLIYGDEVNGLHIYTESTDTWAKVTQGGGVGEIDGVDPASLVFPVVWKNRLLLVEKDTSKAWYGAVNSLYGTFTSFDFGVRMRAGGPLVGLYNWSYDAGGGLDTLLVGLSSAGDVVVYGGTNISDADAFGLKGTWTVGSIPAGRRVATDYGGELLILSSTGVVPLSKLVVGTAATDSRIYATRKVATLVSSLVSTRRTLAGWGLVIHPEDNALMVTYPTYAGRALEQLAMAFATGGWGRYRDLPMYSAAPFAGQLFFGTADGRVCINTGPVDGVTLANPSAFTPVEWSLFGAYAEVAGGLEIQIAEIEPIIVAETPTPVVEATARFDFDLTEPSAPTGTATGVDGTWDYSTWDSGVWGGELQASQQRQGAAGMGRTVAVAVRGRSISKTTLVGVRVKYLPAGTLS